MSKLNYLFMKHRMYEAVKKVRAKVRISTKHLDELAIEAGLDAVSSKIDKAKVIYIYGILCEIDDTVFDFVLEPIVPEIPIKFVKGDNTNNVFVSIDN